MIVLRPDEVVFDGKSWGGVVRVSIDRLAAGSVEGYGGNGGYATLVDVMRQRVVLRVVQEIEGDDLATPIPGTLAELVLVAGSGSDVGRRRVRCPCVVESVQHRISDYGATRTITLIAQSESGDADPIVVTAL